ncbi:MAG: hypothetical protein ACIAQU_04670 [Phycisphaerales bacterium JB064]
MVGRRGKALVLIAMAGVCTLGSMGLTQDGPPPPPPQERGEGDPGRLRGLLERRLETVQRQEQRLQEIMDRLDAGESPAEIIAELRDRGELALLGEFGRGAGEREREGGGRGMRGNQEGPQSPEAMDPEDYALWRNRIFAFFDEHAPEMAKRLREGGDSEDVRRAVFRLRREVERLIDLKEKGSEEFRPALERLRNGMRIADVLGRVRQAASAGTLTADVLANLRRELTAVVAEQYDAQLDGREQLLDRMGQRLDGAREKLERERAERSQRIEAEVQAMLDRATSDREGARPEGGPRRGPR